MQTLNLFVLILDVSLYFIYHLESAKPHSTSTATKNMQNDPVYSVVGNMAAAGLVTTKVGSIMRTD